MRTVQEILRETNIDNLIETYFAEYPIQYEMVEDKEWTLDEIRSSAQGQIRRCIRGLLEMEARPSPENIFYAVYCYGEDRFPDVRANLSYRSDILTQDLPEHYAWELTDWAEILGSSAAETKLTVDHMKKVLADIIEEMTFFGFEQSAWEGRTAEVHQSLREAEESAKRGEYIPAEEVFAQFGLPKDEPDETADELSRKVAAAENEYNLYFRRREAARVRELLQKS